jgi:hypothetical protein
VSDGDDQDEQPIRVALCGLTTMIDDIVSTLVRDLAGIDIVARGGACDDFAHDAKGAGADIVICALDGAEMERRWSECTRRSSLPAVLNLSHDATSGHVYAMYAYDRALDALSGDSLVAALRAVAAARAP